MILYNYRVSFVMLSLQQIKHILQYYCLDMMEHQDSNIPSHIQRDCVYMNKTRAEICSDIFMNPLLKRIIEKIHKASRIHQLNTVPRNSLCFIDNIKIPIATGGVQVILYYKDKPIEHICIQKKYQRLCYYYFKLRHFPDIIKHEIKIWLNKQPWYLPKSCTVNLILKRLLESNMAGKLHMDLFEMIDVLNS